MTQHKLLYGWDATNEEWVKLQVDANGYVKVDMSGINLGDLANVNAPTPSDQDSLTYDQATGLWIPQAATPAAHHTTHENGGADEISVAGLSGILANGQMPLAHKTSHQNGGSDKISVAGLSGLLADDQHVLDTEVDARINALAILESLLTTQGDIIRRGASAAERLAIGSAGQVLKVVGGVPAWAPHVVGFTSKARAYLSGGNQTIPSATDTKVQLNAESYDVDGEFDSTTNYRFTATNAGYYYTSASIRYLSPVADKLVFCAIWVSGSLVSSAGYHTSHTGRIQIQANDIVYLDAADYIELNAYHECGSDIDIDDGSFKTFMAIHRLS